MNKKTTITLALSTSMMAGLALGTVQAADSNPFAATKVDSGYLQLAENKTTEMSCGAGACGGAMKDAKGGSTLPPDADKDGKVTKEEFVTFHSQLFDKADANKDGILEAEEMKAMHQKMGEGMCGGKMEKTKPETSAEAAPKPEAPAEKAATAK